MKTCPVCKQTLFDDMESCFGCLHKFSKSEAASSKQFTLSDQLTPSNQPTTNAQLAPSTQINTRAQLTPSNQFVKREDVLVRAKHAEQEIKTMNQEASPKSKMVRVGNVMLETPTSASQIVLKIELS